MPAGIDSSAIDRLLERYSLPPMVGRLAECALRRSRVELYDGGWLLVALPTGARGLGQPLALLLHGSLLVSIGARGSLSLDHLWQSVPAGVDAAQLAARAVLAALSVPIGEADRAPCHLATRARVLASQRDVIAQVGSHLPIAAASAQLEILDAALAHDRAQLGRAMSSPSSRSAGRRMLARRAAPVVISLIACAASALSPGHRFVGFAAQAGLLVSLLTF